MAVSTNEFVLRGSVYFVLTRYIHRLIHPVATFAIRQALRSSQNVSVNLYMSLFDEQIKLILLYGCPIWGMPSHNCTIKVKGNISSGNLRENLKNIFPVTTNVDIVSCRFHKKEVAFLT